MIEIKMTKKQRQDLINHVIGNGINDPCGKGVPQFFLMGNAILHKGIFRCRFLTEKQGKSINKTIKRVIN